MIQIHKTFPIRAAIAAPVTDYESAKRWIEGIVAADLSFHFEDDPASIVHLKTDERLFTDEEIPVVRERVNALYDFHYDEHDCPIGYMLHLLETQGKL